MLQLCASSYAHAGVKKAKVIASPPDKKIKKKTKKPLANPTTAYALRKERKRLLVEQVEYLQNKLDELKFRLLVKQGEVDKAMQRRETENVVLHELIREQLVALATMQAAVASHVVRTAELSILGTLQPAQSVIQLGTDREGRTKTLMALKGRKLWEAERYIVAKSNQLEPGSSYCHEERFDSPDGDYCTVRFENAPIRGASAKVVFDTILDTILNAEILLSELFGSINVREDNEFESAEFTQVRLVSSVSSGVTVEANTVLFSNFTDGVDGGFGIITQDFVDLDELHPYKSNERVRRDTTTIISVRGRPAQDDELPEVVVSRWTLLKIHHSDLNISRETAMKESSMCWGDTAQKCINQKLQNTNTSTLTLP
ncbi:unnamed protein product [Phytophthora lilii]|uniref:Unnamed protein product n=1 Tax=Phytophthora lilii TaxID=2077276 RepID=A0A9W6WNM2_9STRA|nr:unnamed protein product [Phytophthora lilii]